MTDLAARIADVPSIASAVDAIRELAAADLPFGERVVQLALQSTELDGFEQALASLYRISLDAQHPFLPDLVDHVLQWVEQVREECPVEYA